MAVVKKIDKAPGLFQVECPGCDMPHQIHTQHHSGNGANWSFNDNMEKPTFSPSLLVRFTWGEEQKENICHSYIKDGQWQFLNDCTHELAGQTVAMLEVD